MKWLSVFVCLVLLSSGCVSKKEKSATYGPLSKINEYQVLPVFFPRETSDKEILLDYLVEVLGKLGTVDIATGCINESLASCAGLVISIGENEQTKTGSINVFAEAEIVINKHKSSCEAWKTIFQDPTSAYPVDGKDGIAFVKDLTAISPDLKTVITQMVAQFAEQYRQDNPGSKPIFHVYSRMFSALSS
jgi:hypothetical protein